MIRRAAVSRGYSLVDTFVIPSTLASARLSAVVPSYNLQLFIGTCLPSIIKQTLPPLLI
jgi:hypothetical protein